MTDSPRQDERFVAVDQKVRVVVDPDFRGNGVVYVVPVPGGPIELHHFRALDVGGQVRAIGAVVGAREIVDVSVEAVGPGVALLQGLHALGAPVRAVTSRRVTNSSLESR